MPVPLGPLAETLYDPAQREQAMTAAGVPSLASKLANAMIPETGMPGSVGQWSFANKAAQAALPEGLDYFSQALKKHLPDFHPQRILEYIANHPREVHVYNQSPLPTLSSATRAVHGVTTMPTDVTKAAYLGFDPQFVTWPQTIGHEIPHVAQGLSGHFENAMPGLTASPTGRMLYQAMDRDIGPELFSHLIDQRGYSQVKDPRLFRQALEAWFK